MSSFLRLGRVFMVLALLAGLGTAAAPQPSHAGAGCLPGSLKAKLNQIRQKFGPVSIVSTHRPGARIADHVIARVGTVRSTAATRPMNAHRGCVRRAHRGAGEPGR